MSATSMTVTAAAEERAERLTDLVGDDLGVVDGREHGADEEHPIATAATVPGGGPRRGPARPGPRRGEGRPGRAAPGHGEPYGADRRRRPPHDS